MARVAIVTGGTRGIGAAISLALNDGDDTRVDLAALLESAADV